MKYLLSLSDAKTPIGYYLVRESDNSRHFISKTIDVSALEKVANKVLNDKFGYGYWIDYYHGLDVTGRQHWRNLDLSDHFEI